MAGVLTNLSTGPSLQSATPGLVAFNVALDVLSMVTTIKHGVLANPLSVQVFSNDAGSSKGAEIPLGDALTGVTVIVASVYGPTSGPAGGPGGTITITNGAAPTDRNVLIRFAPDTDLQAVLQGASIAFT